MKLEVELQAYDGPLDLLLSLIEKNKINIFDIPIVEITDQYLEYVRNMKEEDLDVMSEFMVLAAQLIAIKCRMLLPKEEAEDEEEGDPREDLVRRLLEYKTYKYMGAVLKERMSGAEEHFYKEDTTPAEVRAYKPDVRPEELVGDLTMSRLHEVFRSCLRRQSERVDPVRSRFGVIEKEQVSLPDTLEEILAYAETHQTFSFRDLLMKQNSRLRTVVAFLVVLELISCGYIKVSQNDPGEDIEIRTNPDMTAEEVRTFFSGDGLLDEEEAS